MGSIMLRGTEKHPAVGIRDGSNIWLIGAWEKADCAMEQWSNLIRTFSLGL